MKPQPQIPPRKFQTIAPYVSAVGLGLSLWTASCGATNDDGFTFMFGAMLAYCNGVLAYRGWPCRYRFRRNKT